MSVTAMWQLYRAGSPATSGLSAGHGRSARYPQPGLTDRGVHSGPGRLAWGELLPEIRHELGELTVSHAVLEGGHVAEIARNRGGDAVQDDLDQIVRHRAVQIAVQRQRRPAAEQGRAADLVANGAGAFVEPRADGRDCPGSGHGFDLGRHRLLCRPADRGFVE